MDLSTFHRLRRHVRIAHHLPGRIRLRASAAARALRPPDPAWIERFVSAVDGIEHVRLNRKAGSIVVRYAPARITPACWETLIRGDDSEAEALLLALVDERLDEPMRKAARRRLEESD